MRDLVHLDLQPSGLVMLYPPVALLAMRQQEVENVRRIRDAGIPRNA